MSLFKGEGIDVKGVAFQKRVAPISLAASSELWHDQIQNNIVGSSGGINVAPQLLVFQNVTPINVTNNTTATTLMSANIPIALANAVGKSLEVFCAGTYNTNAAQTPTIQFQLTVGGVNVLSWTSGTTTASKTNMPWEVAGYITLANNGANANVEAHGQACVTLGATAGGATTTYLDVNSAVSANINLQANANVALVATLSSSDAATLVNQRQMLVFLSN